MSFTDPSSFDPFLGTEVETLHHYRTDIKITLAGGFDVTNALQPFLLSVRVRDTGVAEAEIELDDRDGRMPIPPHYSPIQISMGWVGLKTRIVFDGVIQEIWHDFGRKSGGRRMTIRALSANLSPLKQLKQPMTAHMGDGAPPASQLGPGILLRTWLQDVAQRAGATIDVSRTFDIVTNDRWDQENQSAMDLFNQLAERYHAVRPVRVERGDHFRFVAAGDISAPKITAKWNDNTGGNLISWHISPVTARPAWGGAYNRWFDTQAAQWNYVYDHFTTTAPGAGEGIASPTQGTATSTTRPVQLPASAPNFRAGEGNVSITGPALFQEPQPAPNQLEANNWTFTTKLDRALAGQGKITIDGEPDAAWMGTVHIIGARPGVDGTYWIMEAEHFYSRQGGYITTLDVGLLV